MGGTGRRLVAAAIGCATETSHAFVNVEVANDNSAAMRLHESLEFSDWITPTRFLELRL